MLFLDRFGDVPNFNVKMERDNWAGVSIVSSPKKQHLASWFLGDKHGITFPSWKGFKGWATQFPNGVLFRARWVNFWRVQKLRFLWVILRLWFIHMGMPSMGIYPWNPQHPERFYQIWFITHPVLKNGFWTSWKFEFVFFCLVNQLYDIQTCLEPADFMASNLDFENLSKHRIKPRRCKDLWN